MKLNNIRITNYRCFKEADIAFDDHITLSERMEQERLQYWMQLQLRSVHFYLVLMVA